MDTFEWSLVARMFASLSRVEGMKAANEYRIHRGETIAYPESSFEEEAFTLSDISEALRQRAG